MQNKKHQQVKHYNKSAKDLHSLKTGDAVYIQLVPGARNWAKGVIIQVINNRAYKVKTNVGGFYVRKKIHQNQAHRLQAKSKDCSRTSQGHTRQWAKHNARRSIRKPQRLIDSMNFIWAQDRRRGFT